MRGPHDRDAQTLRDEGKVRFIGMSGILPNLAEHIAMSVFDVFQIPYSMVQREHEELITAAARSGAGTLVRGTARGAPSENKQWRSGPLKQSPEVSQRNWEQSGIEELLGDMSPIEFSLRFSLSHRDVSATIIGTANVDHLRPNVVIAEKGPLPVDLYQEAMRRLDT